MVTRMLRWFLWMGWNHHGEILTRPSLVSDTCYRICSRRTGGCARHNWRRWALISPRSSRYGGTSSSGRGAGTAIVTCKAASRHTTLTEFMISSHNVARFRLAIELVKSDTFCCTVSKVRICRSCTDTSWLIASSLRVILFSSEDKRVVKEARSPSPS